MSPTEFEYFPFLPKEIRDQIWGYIVHNTQQRLLKDTGRAHFFTLYNGDAYSAERPILEDLQQARPVEAEEKLHLDEDRPSFADAYFLAAPRDDPWLPSTWDAMDALVLGLEWMACQESRDCALRHVKHLTDETEYPVDEDEDAAVEEDEQDDEDPDGGD